MTTNKTTYLSAVRYAIENLSGAPEDVIERLNALEASLIKRASAERKPTAKQVQSAADRDAILAALVPGTLYSLADIAKMFDKEPAWAAPKVNALAEAGLVVKETIKRKVHVRLVEGD